MAKQIKSTEFESIGSHTLHVWTNHENAVALKQILGVVQVDWLGGDKYEVTIDPRFDGNELAQEILALK